MVRLRMKVRCCLAFIHVSYRCRMRRYAPVGRHWWFLPCESYSPALALNDSSRKISRNKVKALGLVQFSVPRLFVPGQRLRTLLKLPESWRRYLARAIFLSRARLLSWCRTLNLLCIGTVNSRDSSGSPPRFV